MGPEQFSVFRHTAVHELMHLNALCEEEFHIASCPRWEYDLDDGTLTFSENGVPKVLASIHVIGTTSISGGTWMWGWANESLPTNVRKEVAKAREFGRAENIPELIAAELPDDEYLGWGMTAVAAKLLQAKGAYRCPGENGFVYVAYSSIRFAASNAITKRDEQIVECSHHIKGFATYICEHLFANPAQKWFSNKPDEEQPWPDAWCASCEGRFLEQGEWNDKNQSSRHITLVCHHCYENNRSRATES